MYYTGIDPFTKKEVYTAKDMHEKRLQKALLLYWDPAHHDEVREALMKAGRADLIGSKAHCLVPPASGKGALPIAMRRGFGGPSSGAKRPSGHRGPEKSGHEKRGRQ